MADTYTTIAVTKEARTKINAATAAATGLTGRRLSNSEVLLALIEVASRHPDEIKAQLQK